MNRKGTSYILHMYLCIHLLFVMYALCYIILLQLLYTIIIYGLFENKDYCLVMSCLVKINFDWFLVCLNYCACIVFFVYTIVQYSRKVYENIYAKNAHLFIKSNYLTPKRFSSHFEEDPTKHLNIFCHDSPRNA